MKKVLLHICCSICAAGAVQRLKEEGYNVIGFYFNPNIHPRGEYERRKEHLKKIQDSFGIEMIEERYEPKEWFAVCREFSHEKERGRRCQECFRLRLHEAYKVSKERGCDYFATTLTISPHKESALIFNISCDIAGDHFLSIDFKKQDGFKKANQFAKEHGFYRQDYCGCVYILLYKIRNPKQILNEENPNVQND